VDEAEFATCGSSITNQGMGGWTLQSIDLSFNTFISGGGSFVVIQGGTNNLTPNDTDPNTEMRAAIESMTAKAIAVSMIPVFVNITPLGSASGWSAAKQANLESYNTWLSNYVTINGYQMADVYSVLTDGSDNLKTEYDCGDGVHLSDLGYRVMGAKIATAIIAAGPY